jgi:galactitol-specific phosphotransferase system IIC component
MIQTIITIIIVAAAVLYTAYKLYRFFTKAEDEFACNSKKCSTCSMGGTCTDFKKEPKDDDQSPS